MKRVLALIFIVVLAVAGFAGFKTLTDCGDDNICETNVATGNVLEEYESSGDKEPVYEWITGSHDGALHTAKMSTFVEWGNENTEAMNQLLDSWPDDSRADSFEQIEWSSKDIGQEMEFQLPDI